MRKKIKTNLDEAVQYLDFELKNDTQNLKKTRRFWLNILTKINLYFINTGIWQKITVLKLKKILKNYVLTRLILKFVKIKK